MSTFFNYELQKSVPIYYTDQFVSRKTNCGNFIKKFEGNVNFREKLEFWYGTSWYDLSML